MEIDEAFLQVLNNDSTLISLVNTKLTPTISPRIFPDFLPEEEDDDNGNRIKIVNGITYMAMPNKINYTLTGKSLSEDIYQFDIWGRTNIEVTQIYNALISALSNFHGIYNNLNVQLAQQYSTGQKFFYAFDPDKPTIIQHRLSTDYKFFYKNL